MPSSLARRGTYGVRAAEYIGDQASRLVNFGNTDGLRGIAPGNQLTAFLLLLAEPTITTTAFKGIGIAMTHF